VTKERNIWNDFNAYVEGFNVYHAVFFFFAYPEQSLQQEVERRGYIMNETYLNLFFRQQLAMYARLLNATDLPFIVAAVDATGTQAETYAHIMHCFNEVMQLAGKVFRLT
jgi:hypothetical protein